jgi:uncharacterized protein (TIGR01244 family)
MVICEERPMSAIKTYGLLFAILATAALPVPLPTNAQELSGPSPTDSPAAVRSAELGETINVHSCGKLYLAGQFSTTDLTAISDAGIARVISLRTEGEVDWDEKSAVEQAGMEFVVVPFREAESLTDEVFDRVRSLLGDRKTATLFHCGSANRVGAVWLPYRVLDEGIPLATAIEEAKNIGLRNEEYLDKARRYIRRKQTARDLQTEESDEPADESGESSGGERSQPGSVDSQAAATEAAGQTTPPAGINDSFVDPELNVDEFIKRFEIESREVYASRQAVLHACQLQPGQRVADIGAGTGLYTRMFAEAVESAGWVYAIDIAPRFIEHINTTSQQLELRNVTGIVGTQSSIHLPPESVDLAFVCDTWHHFEATSEIAASIYQAVKPGGQLILIDFDRIPGVSREWIVSHVRAGKEVFRHEIETAGFELVEQVAISGFAENYFLRFQKK